MKNIRIAALLEAVLSLGKSVDVTVEPTDESFPLSGKLYISDDNRLTLDYYVEGMKHQIRENHFQEIIGWDENSFIVRVMIPCIRVFSRLISSSLNRKEIKVTPRNGMNAFYSMFERVKDENYVVPDNDGKQISLIPQLAKYLKEFHPEPIGVMVNTPLFKKLIGSLTTHGNSPELRFSCGIDNLSFSTALNSTELHKIVYIDERKIVFSTLNETIIEVFPFVDTVAENLFNYIIRDIGI